MDVHRQRNTGTLACVPKTKVAVPDRGAHTVPNCVPVPDRSHEHPAAQPSTTHASSAMPFPGQCPSAQCGQATEHNATPWDISMASKTDAQKTCVRRTCIRLQSPQPWTRRAPFLLRGTLVDRASCASPQLTPDAARSTHRARHTPYGMPYKLSYVLTCKVSQLTCKFSRQVAIECLRRPSVRRCDALPVTPPLDTVGIHGDSWLPLGLQQQAALTLVR